MPSRETKPAKLDAAAHAELENLKQALRRQGFPGEIGSVHILSALVLYSTAPQVAGMLNEYFRYTDELDQEASGET